MKNLKRIQINKKMYGFLKIIHIFKKEAFYCV